jgi:hypothetical protein
MFTVVFRLLFLIISFPILGLAAPDGVYTGTTSQGRDISFTVSGDVINEHSISFYCSVYSATVTAFSSCTIAGDGSFTCGSSDCPSAPYVANFEVSGIFSGASVSGSFDLAYRPSMAGGCCYLDDITFSASASPASPVLTINDTSVSEGDAGSSPAQLQVTLSPAATGAVTVDWTTGNGTADSSDYAPDSGTLSFSPGQTSRNVTVMVYGDTVVEGNEVFNVNLSNASDATIGDSSGQCTIIDDDSAGVGQLQSIVPAAGRGPGAGGSMWITALNACNQGDVTATVTLLWFLRNQPNLAPQSYSTTIPAGATMVMDDVIMEAFGISQGGGAIGIISDQPLSAAAAILNTAGGNEFGQGFAAIPVGAAVATGQQTTVVGLKHNSTYRTNVYLVDTTGSGSTVTLTLVDTNGMIRSTEEFSLGPYMPRLPSLDTFGKTNFDNGVLIISTSAGAVIAGASRVNAGTGDPVTLAPPIEVQDRPAGPYSSDGRYEISLYDSEGWSSSGGYLEVADDKVESIDLTYYNMDDADCNLIFPVPMSFSPPADLADFAAGVHYVVTYNIGILTFTWQFNHDGTAGLAGTLDVFGSDFETDYSGCNGSFPQLTLNGGKSD